MQSSNFDFIYNKEDQAVALNNLLAMAKDAGTKGVVGIGDNNSGWCYALAPLRQFLADPRFIRLLRKYKEHYYYNRQLRPNEEFLKAMYGENYKTNTQWKVANYILTTLCQYTDANGKLLSVQGPDRTYDYSFDTEVKDPKTGQYTQQRIDKHVDSPYVYLIRLVHTIFHTKKQNDPGVMYNYLSDCTAIMSESPNVLSYSTTKKICAGEPVNLAEMEKDLNKGLCITVAANGRHAFNIYKVQEHNKHNYRLIGSTQHTGLSFSNLINAMTAISPNAEQPKDQQYWLCDKIKESQLKNSKKAGIETYLKTHASYLNQPNNQLGFNNKKLSNNQNNHNQFNINNNIMNQNRNNQFNIMNNNNKIPNGKLFKQKINSQKNNINMNMGFNPPMNNFIPQNNFGHQQFNNQINQKKPMNNFIPNMMNKNNMNMMNQNNIQIGNGHNQVNMNKINNPFANQNNMPKKKVSNQHQALQNLINEYDNLCENNKLLSANPNNQQIINNNCFVKENIWQNIKTYVNQHNNNQEVCDLYKDFLRRHPGRNPHC